MRRVVASLLVVLLAGLALPALADDVPGIPGLSISSFDRASTRNTPAAITADGDAFTWHASAQGQPGNNYIQCLKFRVQSRKAITRAKWRIEFLDTFQNPQFTWDVERVGNFAPGELVGRPFDSSVTYTNQGDQSCFVVPVGRDLRVGFGQIVKARITTTDVVFADGSVWHAGQPWDQAFAADGSHFPPFRATMRWANEGRSPIQVLGASTRYDSNGNPEQCVSFRNVARVPATRVEFEWRYMGSTNDRVVTKTATDNGTYTPPVRIDDQCWKVTGLNSDQIKRIAFNDLHVSRVSFNDGSVWTEGQDFTRAFGNNGDPMTPTLVAGGGASPLGPGPQPGSTPPPVQVFGGGSGSGGGKWGAIAVNPDATFATLAQDRESAALAAADAIAMCNARAGAGACTSPLQFGGNATAARCGAVAIFRSTPPTALLGTANTERDAQAAALTKAGANTANASILASGCNSQ